MGADIRRHPRPKRSTSPPIVGAPGAQGVPDLDFFVVFSLFRWAAIAAGVYRRALDGNAADARALTVGTKFKVLAEVAWGLASSVR